MRAVVFAVLALLVACAEAETTGQLESRAERELEINISKAQELFREAAERRLKEAAVFAVDKDDFEILPADEVDDELGMRELADARQVDAFAENYIRAAADFEKGAKPHRCDECLKLAEGVKGVSKKVLDELAALRKFIAENRDATEHEPPPPKKVRQPFKRPKGKLADRTYANLETFPKDESATVSPKTLADMGVKEKHTLIAGEIDWDAENATECVEEALASGATTVIFEDRGSPWYVQCIRPRSNQRLVFKKGVRVYMDRVSCQNCDRGSILQIDNVKNVIVEGEGEPGDVIIAKFPDKASRQKWQPEEGGSGISISGGRNIVIRNLTSSWNSRDGIIIGGSQNGASEDIWIENCVFANNYRQGMSVINCAGLYCRNVSFLDTFGGEPMCGVDFEPCYECVEATSDSYFYDCTFGGNIGSALNWSAGGLFPVTAHVKRCRFLPTPSWHQISINARSWPSEVSNSRQPGKLIFEDCDMTVNASSQKIVFNYANAFDVDIRNFRIRNSEPPPKDRQKYRHPPIIFNIERTFSWWGHDPIYDFANEGRVRVEGLSVEGFGDVKPVGFYDDGGSYSVTNISGTATIDGKVWDLSQFFYNAPEIGWGIIPKFDPKNYLPPKAMVADTPDEAPVTFDLNWRDAWFNPKPEYRALYFEDGQWKMKLICNNVRELGLEKLPVAYYCRGGDSRFKMATKKKDTPFTVYFEMPAGGKPCTLKFRGDGFVKNAKGETVAEFKRWRHKYATFTPTSEAAEIWSITVTSGYGTVWFFPPMSGIVAENPDYLPRHR